ncbi:MAG: MFS transporter [Halomonas sp.]|nr:YbfB/YjiJ family MFS transporter [Halomonas sp.]MDN6314562.1 MFS transporter [Halomonas sp.]MDN6336066.1 MFS transporter [Halomonas sp.]
MINRAELPALFTGMMATLAGIGVARFAYTPLLPAIIQAEWFSASQAAYLGAANLLGYLIGALAGHPLSERYNTRGLFGLCFAGIALSFLLCAGPGSFGWFFLWRLVSGVAGAILVVVGPSLALTATPPARRAGVGTLVFTGIGLGTLVSALVVPTLLAVSLTATWLALGLLVVLAGFCCDRHLVRLHPLRTTPPPAARQAHTDKKPAPATRPTALALVVALVMVAYGLDAIGFVPHTVFWVDYLAREQALGAHAASLQWAIFGLGALCGPFIVSGVTRLLGWHQGLVLAFATKAAAVALPLVSIALISRSASSFLVGAMVPGIVALTSGRLAELAGPARHKRLWGQATATFAAAQAFSGYGMSALYDAWHTYTPLYAIGSAVLAGGLVLVLLSQAVYTRRVSAAAP